MLTQELGKKTFCDGLWSKGSLLTLFRPRHYVCECLVNKPSRDFCLPEFPTIFCCVVRSRNYSNSCWLFMSMLHHNLSQSVVILRVKCNESSGKSRDAFRHSFALECLDNRSIGNAETEGVVKSKHSAKLIGRNVFRKSEYL